ncbi:hypothetical protein Tco_1351995 [Tanacetum coccineum]
MQRISTVSAITTKRNTNHLGVKKIYNYDIQRFCNGSTLGSQPPSSPPPNPPLSSPPPSLQVMVIVPLGASTCIFLISRKKKMNQQNLPPLDHTENKEAAIDDIVCGLVGSDDESKTTFSALSWLIGKQSDVTIQCFRGGNLIVRQQVKKGLTPQTAADVFDRFRPQRKNLLSAVKTICGTVTSLLCVVYDILSVVYLDVKPLLK